MAVSELSSLISVEAGVVVPITNSWSVAKHTAIASKKLNCVEKHSMVMKTIRKTDLKRREWSLLVLLFYVKQFTFRLGVSNFEGRPLLAQ